MLSITAFWPGCPLSWRCLAEDSVGSSSSSSEPASAVSCLCLPQLPGEIVPRRGWRAGSWGRPSSCGSPSPPSAGAAGGMPLKEAGQEGRVGGFVEMCFASLKFALWDGPVLTNVWVQVASHLNPSGGRGLRADSVPPTCGNVLLSTILINPEPKTTLQKTAQHGKSNFNHFLILGKSKHVMLNVWNK